MATKTDYLSKLVETVKSDVSAAIACSQRCKIIKDNGDNTFNCQPLALYSNGKKRAPLLYLPVLYTPQKITINGDTATIKLNLKVGDVVQVVFDDRDTSNASGSTTYALDSTRTHDVNDGVIIGKIYEGDD